jgi:hypothetical protein
MIAMPLRKSFADAIKSYVLTAAASLLGRRNGKTNPQTGPKQARKWNNSQSPNHERLLWKRGRLDCIRRGLAGEIPPETEPFFVKNCNLHVPA